jgi:hypothetical protein
MEHLLTIVPNVVTNSRDVQHDSVAQPEQRPFAHMQHSKHDENNPWKLYQVLLPVDRTTTDTPREASQQQMFDIGPNGKTSHPIPFHAAQHIVHHTTS